MPHSTVLLGGAVTEEVACWREERWWGGPAGLTLQGGLHLLLWCHGR